MSKIIQCMFGTIVLLIPLLLLMSCNKRIFCIGADNNTKAILIFLLIATILEFYRGILHFLYPKESHTEVSKIVPNYELDPDAEKTQPLYLVTYQFGATNLLLGFMYMLILIISIETKKCNTLFFSQIYLYIFFTIAVVRTLQVLTFTVGDNVHDNIPQSVKDDPPPGAMVQTIQLIVQIIAFIVAFVNYKNKSKNNPL